MNNPNPTESETPKYRHLVVEYCNGCGIDVGSQGLPVVPWAWSLDLPHQMFLKYNGGFDPRGPIQIRGDATKIPAEDGTLDFVYSSHLLEDFLDWWPCLKEWVRVLKPGGHLIVLIPDKELWNKAVAAGRDPNCDHRHEGSAGELSQYALTLGCEVIRDSLSGIAEDDFTIVGVFKKVANRLSIP